MLVIVDPILKTLTVMDNGPGMTASEMEQNICMLVRQDIK
jgi:HSP90 family molecular chaperone